MGESRGSSESRGYSTPSYSRSSESRSSYSSSSESRGYSSESRSGLSYQDWLSTNPWIARGGLSSQGELNQAYEEWVRVQNGGSRRTTVSSTVSEQPAPRKYNSIDDVDKLIKKLEASLPNDKSDNPAINEALEAKRQKIEELKKLVAQAKAKQVEDRILAQLKKDNEELDDAMDSINRGFRK